MPPQLIADIGGTNARFALQVDGTIRDEVVLACADYPDIVSAVEAYLLQIGATAGGRPQEGAIAIAGPVGGDEIRMTNHAWRFSAAAVRRALGLKRFMVLNDWTAMAMAVRHLPQHELVQVGGSHSEPQAAIALLGPGTGLGVSGLVHHQGAWIPVPGEGGHVTFAPADRRELEILQRLWKQYSHVSAERLLSGPGLVVLYQTLCQLKSVPEQALSPAEITQLGLSNHPICKETLEIFCGMLGTMAANLVVTLGAVGGVYIGGGIVPRLLEFFVTSPFRSRFEAKGRYERYLAPVPAWVIMSKEPALVGIARAFIDPGPRLDAA